MKSCQTQQAEAVALVVEVVVLVDAAAPDAQHVMLASRAASSSAACSARAGSPRRTSRTGSSWRPWRRCGTPLSTKRKKRVPGSSGSGDWSSASVRMPTCQLARDRARCRRRAASRQVVAAPARRGRGSTTGAAGSTVRRSVPAVRHRRAASSLDHGGRRRPCGVRRTARA